METERQRRIINALNMKGVNRPCPRCGNPNFEVVGESVVSLQESPGTFTIGGPAIPVALVACNNCGYLTEHALGPLGLLAGAK